MFSKPLFANARAAVNPPIPEPTMAMRISWLEFAIVYQYPMAQTAGSVSREKQRFFNPFQSQNLIEYLLIRFRHETSVDAPRLKMVMSRSVFGLGSRIMGASRAEPGTLRNYSAVTVSVFQLCSSPQDSQCRVVVLGRLTSLTDTEDIFQLHSLAEMARGANIPVHRNTRVKLKLCGESRAGLVPFRSHIRFRASAPLMSSCSASSLCQWAFFV
jgi:hypothetical protein